MPSDLAQIKVLLVSPVAPPIGGNSVHARRLLDALVANGVPAMALDYQAKQEKGDNVIVLLGGLEQKIRRLLDSRRSFSPDAIVHFHVSAFGRFKWIAPFLVVLFSGHPKAITIHSGSFVTQVDRAPLRQYVTQLLHHFDAIITVNVEQRDFLLRLGLDDSSIFVIPAFIAEKPRDDKGQEYLDQLPDNKTIVITSGYLTPIYNYDVLIDCMDRLVAEDYHFVFAFYNQVNPEYSDHIYHRLEDRLNVTILKDQDSQTFLNVLRHSDIYVRPTLTDGDAVAIREALVFRKIVLASSCVVRPAECHLFPANDADALFKLLANVPALNLNFGSVDSQPSSTVKRLIDVYDRIQATHPVP